MCSTLVFSVLAAALCLVEGKYYSAGDFVSYPSVNVSLSELVDKYYRVAIFGFEPPPTRLLPSCVVALSTNALAAASCELPRHCGSIAYSEILNKKWYGSENVLCVGLGTCVISCESRVCHACGRRLREYHAFERRPDIPDLRLVEIVGRNDRAAFDPQNSLVNFYERKDLVTGDVCIIPSVCVAVQPVLNVYGVYLNLFQDYSLTMHPQNSFCYDVIVEKDLNDYCVPLVCSRDRNELYRRYGLLLKSKSLPFAEVTVEGGSHSVYPAAINSSYFRVDNFTFITPLAPAFVYEKQCVQLQSGYSFFSPYASIVNITLSIITDLLYVLIQAVKETLPVIFAAVLRVVSDVLAAVGPLLIRLRVIEVSLLFVFVILQTDSMYTTVVVCVFAFLLLQFSIL
jgi:hypothetical protein